MLDRDLPVGAWVAPKRVEVDEANDRLLWWPNPKTVVDPTPGGVDDALLTRFINLAGASSEAIAEFARQWGVIGTCEHGLPCTHNPPQIYPGRLTAPSCTTMFAEGAITEGMGIGPFAEPLEVWHSLTTRIQKIVLLDAQLSNGLKGSFEDWMIALAHKEQGWDAEKWSGDYWMLAMAAQEILELANVRPLIRWTGQGPYEIVFGAAAGSGLYGHGVLAGVATQLAFMLARTDHLGICSGCGRPYSLELEGRPRRGKRMFCRRCREAGVPDLMRQRDKRARGKQQAGG